MVSNKSMRPIGLAAMAANLGSSYPVVDWHAASCRQKSVGAGVSQALPPTTVVAVPGYQRSLPYPYGVEHAALCPIRLDRRQVL